MNHPGLSSILRINRRRRQLLQSRLQHCGYVGTMHLIVLHLHRAPGASQDEVARFFSIDKGSVARDARRLEEMGHIRRETDPEDRRQYQLYLTPAGEDMRDRILDLYDGFYRQMTDGLSDREREDLERLLALAEKNVCGAGRPAVEKQGRL